MKKKISSLFDNYTLFGDDVFVNELAFDTKAVKQGSLFFCLEGKNTDGHKFAKVAQDAGAAAIVTQKKLNLQVPQVLVKDTRTALAYASAKFFDEPAKSLKMIALTGTNGKTTTTYIIKSILEHAGKRVGVIGTNAVMIGSIRKDAVLTTPDPIELHSILFDMKQHKIEYVVMEASAHALFLNKLSGITFEVSAFTNLSQDHLDYFASMDMYFEAKKRLFSFPQSKKAVLNADDAYFARLVKDIKIPYSTYGCLNPADVFSMDLSMSVGGIKYLLNLNDDIGEVRFNLPGKFNMYNSLCAAAVTGELGIQMNDIIEGIRSLTKVDGRFNIINTSKCSVIIDFAHTEEGLTNILNTIREFAPKRVITVFGCGGDRDRTKRPLMGRAAARLSDICIITSDNPRTEKPEDIIFDIIAGIDEEDKAKVIALSQRMSAILKAIELAQSGDIVLVAGKGAECYQEVMGVRQSYNDEEYILRLIEEKKI